MRKSKTVKEAKVKRGVGRPRKIKTSLLSVEEIKNRLDKGEVVEATAVSTETESITKKKIVLYITHSSWSDLAKDIIGDLFMFFAITFNYKFWNGDWWVTTFLLTIWLFSAVAGALQKGREFNSWGELENYINSEKTKI